MGDDGAKRHTSRRIAISVLSIGALAAGAVHEAAAGDQMGDIRAQFENAFTPGVASEGDGGGPGDITEGGPGNISEGGPGAIHERGPGAIIEGGAAGID